jgi:dihydroxy-acid dehydratase
MDGFEGAFTVGKITEEQRIDVVRHACPGPGACGGMYTYVIFPLKFRIPIRLMMVYATRPSGSANTMSSALEVLGLSLPYSSSTPATFDGTCTVYVRFSTLGLTWRICFEEKLKECKRAAVYLKKLLERDIKPRYAWL